MTFGIRGFFQRIVTPLSSNEDQARSEFVLNVLLVGIITLSCTALSINLIKGLLEMKVPVSVAAIFISLALFSGCYVLSRRGHSGIAAYIVLGTFFFFPTSMALQWGVDLPTALLTYTLVIVMSGILVNTRFAFFMTLLIGIAIISIHSFHETGVLRVDSYWRLASWETADTIVTMIMFGLIATVCWLSNREIQKSLARARTSEAMLKEERDILEWKVEERTRELKEIQAEKMAQLYRFAEFGRLSSGVFHDLINPLNAVYLNVERLQTRRLEGDSAASQSTTVNETAEDVERAVQAAKKLERLVASVRKQLAREETKKLFCLNEEIRYVIDLLLYKARAANVHLSFPDHKHLYLFGDAIKFNQIVLNLVANGIDACGVQPFESTGGETREVVVSLEERDQDIVVCVKDQGVGIAEAHLARMFEPFFTTKPEGHGIGLSMTKRIIEKDFEGQIILESTEGKGTTFTVVLPYRAAPISP